MENPIENKLNNDNKSNIDEQRIISLNKFITLSILTFGLYAIWWIYKSWRFFQQKDELRIMPALRAILSVIFLIPLFNRIKVFAKQKGYKSNYSTVLLFICFLIVSFLIYLPDPFWLIAYLSFVFLIPPYKALSFAKKNSTDFLVTEQSSFNWKQIMLIFIGIIFWILIILALTIEDI